MDHNLGIQTWHRTHRPNSVGLAPLRRKGHAGGSTGVTDQHVRVLEHNLALLDVLVQPAGDDVELLLDRIDAVDQPDRQLLQPRRG